VQGAAGAIADVGANRVGSAVPQSDSGAGWASAPSQYRWYMVN
jgi:hypothetical protein